MKGRSYVCIYIRQRWIRLIKRMRKRAKKDRE